MSKQEAEALLTEVFGVTTKADLEAMADADFLESLTEEKAEIAVRGWLLAMGWELELNPPEHSLPLAFYVPSDLPQLFGLDDCEGLDEQPWRLFRYRSWKSAYSKLNSFRPNF